MNFIASPGPKQYSVRIHTRTEHDDTYESVIEILEDKGFLILRQRSSQKHIALDTIAAWDYSMVDAYVFLPEPTTTTASF
jgi:uncharacterized protein (DUF302 family)